MQTGKRQRRQAAALVVQSLWSSTNGGTKKKTASTSTTNNRPVLEVPPMGFGPIREPNPNDVLCGRGGLINGSPGNVQFRNIVAKRKPEYNAKTTKRHEKAHMAAEIVRQIRSMNPPGRFLREDTNGLWFDVGDARAIRKTGQALREAAPVIRQEGDGANPAADGKEDDKGSDSGSDGGKKEEPPKTDATTNASKPEEKKGSPKRKKNETPKKESKKDATEKPAKRSSVTERTPSPDAATTTTRNSATSKRNWLPSMMTGSMRRSSNSDAASVSAETVRSSQTYFIPQSALGPHIANGPVVAMPRMSQGAVFSNHHHQRRAMTEHCPPPHPYQHAHYPYPYAHHMPPPMHVAVHPNHNNNNNMQHLHHPLAQPAAVAVPMMPTRGTLPRGGEVTEEDAFGMNFFPTRDVNMEHSENASQLTLSDISGLSSSMTPGDHPRKHLPKQQQQQTKKPHPPLQPPTTASSQMDEASMLDTTSSLPSFSDILDDVDMASATSGGAGASSSLAMASISSSSVAKMMIMAAPPRPPTKNNNNNNRLLARGGSSSEMKENSNSTGSCVSGKGSEISLPSSCGTALSQFSDSFMALHLSDHNEFE